MSDREAAEPDTLSPSEALDEDELPLGDGAEAPDRWSAADRFGTTPAEIREGEPFDDRLAEELPDVEPEPVPDRPTAITPAGELDESIDEEPADVEPVAPEDLDAESAARARTGGSVADAIRAAHRSV